MNGIEKEIDALGRVVLPIKYRSKLNISKKSKVIISLDNGYIKISPKQSLCALCGASENVSAKVRLCVNCIKNIRNEDI